jgi:hypothetical protein
MMNLLSQHRAYGSRIKKKFRYINLTLTTFQQGRNNERLDSCLSAFELHIKIKHALGYCQAFKGAYGSRIKKKFRYINLTLTPFIILN